MLIAENKGKLSVVDESRFSFFLEKLSIKKVQVAHPQYTRDMMPSRDGLKHSAFAVGLKARLHPDFVAVGIQNREPAAHLHTPFSSQHPANRRVDPRMQRCSH
jgi:hypothetical protein